MLEEKDKIQLKQRRDKIIHSSVSKNAEFRSVILFHHK